MTYTATEQFNLHWQNDQDFYNAVLDYARAFLRRVPGMTAQTLGLNIRNDVHRWCDEGYVSALGWDPDAGRPGPRTAVVQRNQLQRFPGWVMPKGYRPVRSDVLERMAEDMEGQWQAVDETAIGEGILEDLA